tara:strand:+ start:607 stop:753 length:147 start_codon:yes stop_codon:yes gene_type:complete
MKTFTVTFKNAAGELKTEDLTLEFNTVNGVIAWFDETLGLRVKSIEQH